MRESSAWGGVHDALFNGNGLAKRLLIAVVAFSSVITTVITGVELYRDYRQDLHEIDTAFEYIGSSYAPSLSLSVWQFDAEAVRTQLQGLLHLADIEYAGVEIDGNTRWSAGSAESERRREVALPLTHPQADRVLNIGTLRVVASIDSVIARVWSRLLNELVGNAIKTLLVAGFLLVMFQYLVTQHLTKVARFVAGIDLLRPEADVRPLALDRRPRGRPPDVLDTVVAALNGLLNSVRSAHRDLQASQRQLAESELRSRLGLEASSAGLWDCDLLHQRVQVSDECARILGLEPGTPPPELGFWRERIHPDDLAVATEALRKHPARRAGHLRIELRLRHERLGWRWFVLRGGVVERDAGGAPLRALGTALDFTELKEAQQALLEANRQLESRVRERTLALEVARDEAERANRGKSEFLSRMSHELRTPMNAILGFAQLLETLQPTGQSRRWIGEIHRAGDHLLALIDDLLDLARIEAGKLSVRLEPVNLHAVIREAEAMCVVAAESRRIRLAVEPARGALIVLADRTRLRQILVNLLSNAIKYNRDGGSVDVRCERTGRDGKVRLTVSDTGLGMPGDKLAGLFQPFERLGREDSGIRGSGIGLALSKRLAELMHCELGVSSVEGQGSSFWIDLPLTEPAIGVPAAVRREPASAPRRTLRVLYIEDNAVNLAMMQAGFEGRAGLELLTAQDGSSGIAMARAERPDVILLDIQLPRMDGFDVLRELRRDEHLRDTPVIAVTASAMPHDVDRGKAAGFAAYVTKPFRFGKLLALVETCAEQQTRSP